MKNEATLSFDEIHSSSSPLPLEIVNRPQIVWMQCMLCTRHPLPTFRSSGFKRHLPCQGSNWYWCTGTSVWEFAIWLGTCWISVSSAYITFFQWTASGPLSFLCNCRFWSFCPLASADPLITQAAWLHSGAFECRDSALDRIWLWPGNRLAQVLVFVCSH